MTKFKNVIGIIIIVLLALLNVTTVEALEYGCKLKPYQLDAAGTRLVILAHDQHRSLEDSITINSDIVGKISSSEDDTNNSLQGTVEGFYRPQVDGYYALTPVPIFGVELNRARHVVYICAHVDPDPKKTHFTVYLMRGYDMDPNRMENFFGDLFLDTKLKVEPLVVSVLGLSVIKRKLFSWLSWLPLFELSFQLLTEVQGLVSNTIGEITGVGIERITVTKEHLELAGNIDLNNPDKPGFSKVITFDKSKK